MYRRRTYFRPNSIGCRSKSIDKLVCNLNEFFFAIYVDAKDVPGRWQLLTNRRPALRHLSINNKTKKLHVGYASLA